MKVGSQIVKSWKQSKMVFSRAVGRRTGELLVTGNKVSIVRGYDPQVCYIVPIVYNTSP
jgi:hypothetical protein